jgi:hypothetical protein
MLFEKSTIIARGYKIINSIQVEIKYKYLDLLRNT